MPLYEYQCTKCGKVSEFIQKFSDPPMTDCECGAKNSLEKLMSLGSFHLKGSGWYLTDYARKNTPSDSKTPSAKTSGEEAAPKTVAKEAAKEVKTD